MRSTPRALSVVGRVMRVMPLAWSMGAAIALGSLVAPAPAHACGCFTPTNVASPVVQAGEKILFAKQNGTIVMQVLVQYSGPAADFGWLLPLPAVSMNSAGMPGIDVGAQEVFDVLSTLTQPTYTLTTIPCNSGGSGRGIGCGAGDDLFGVAGTADDYPGVAGGKTPLVTQSSVGPYDFAILKADSKADMLKWLTDNGYVVPAGTDAAVAQYIRPGGYFLALRLKAGQTTGDLQPVVLRYQSDLPMVPLVLTAASSTPNLGVLIWTLGAARAIPRNYTNLVIDDAQLDWLNLVQNYADVVTKAVREIDGHHGFVTEFAGSSQILQGSLGTSARFAYLDALTATTDPVQFVRALLVPSTGLQGVVLNAQLTGILGGYIPLPAALVATNVTPSQYYQNLDSYLNVDRKANPQKYTDIEATLAKFSPAALVSDLKARVAAPTLAAQALFADPGLSKLTRMYTVMSPDDMNLDPAFSFNADLPDVAKDHRAQLQAVCPKDGFPSAVLTTENGWKVVIPTAYPQTYPTLTVPYAQRVEVLMDTGMPTVKVDNSDAIQKTLAGAGPGAQGCTALADRRRHPTAGTGLLALMGLGIGLGLLRRRPARSRG